MSDQPDLRLAFLDTDIFENGSIMRGGVLITDIDTKPYEFRCTSPVKPTTIQRMLYGDTFEEYTNVELLGSPLIKATKEKPTLVLVRKAILLNIRPLLSCPVALVYRGQESLISASEKNLKPVTVSSHREFPTEAAAIQAMLAPLTQRRDLLEPFERLHVALAEAHKRHIGDGTPEGKNA